jgi:hypothetical protein
MTQFQLLLAGVIIGTYTTQAAAQAAAVAKGPPGANYTINTVVTTTTSTTFTVPTIAAGLPGGPAIQAFGAAWTVSVDGVIAVNGVPDTTTHLVSQIAFVGGLIWQNSTGFKGLNLWWSKSSLTAAWLPASGTATSPLPGTPPVTPPPTSGTVTRPSYNTGVGFFVLNGKLYDANGNAFTMRGVDRCHYDSSASTAGIAKSGANVVRMGMYLDSVAAANYVAVAQSHIATKVVPIPTMFYFPDGSLTSGNNSAADLAAGIGWWVANAAAFKPLEKYAIINLANEWLQQPTSATWVTAYTTAIGQMRAAGYLGTLLIDTGGYGQDFAGLTTYAAQVFNSDPQKNVMFAFHAYGATTPANVATIVAGLAALRSQGICVAVTELGPGRNIGPSPTLLTPDEIIAACEANGVGWLGWAWDNNNLAGGKSDNNSFSMTLAGPGIYTVAADLTLYGTDIVAQLAKYGAKPATIF